MKKKKLKEKTKLAENKTRNQRRREAMDAVALQKQREEERRPILVGPEIEIDDEDMEWGGEFNRQYQPNECYFVFNYEEGDNYEDGRIEIYAKKGIDDPFLADMYPEFSEENINSKLPYLQGACMESSWELPHGNLDKIKKEMEAEGFTYNAEILEHR